ncbi:MAG: STAS domain-containing protein [Calditrichaeota bacterium]|nr:STAS domain-containing protein [Calditrichota bacterium]
MDVYAWKDRESGVYVIEAPQRLEGETAVAFRSKVKSIVDEGHYCLVIDLKDTVYMDSSGLGAMVSRIATTRSNGGDIRLANLNPFIQELIQVTNLNRVFQIFDSTEAAIASFGDKARKKQTEENTVSSNVVTHP